ncbi:hypothetical protein TCAL_15453 [Tigriopus californicus]|uniref:Uncharacterized protein n=1 Tax=Tigriopus californicus TaxID=6832 RepID=A0A553PRQ8_TIGCA|nr:uncharacterized protein LOC131891403 isoform X2 [Tigriopus californicus]TRY80351.1 hypothetical protein TCAL_15453 [Tigriopus californicus]
MKSFLVPVIIALFGFALVTLADMDDLETEEAKISEDFESGMFDEFISVVTEINDSDENADDEDAEDTAGGQNRMDLPCVSALHLGVMEPLVSRYKSPTKMPSVN